MIDAAGKRLSMAETDEPAKTSTTAKFNPIIGGNASTYNPTIGGNASTYKASLSDAMKGYDATGYSAHTQNVSKDGLVENRLTGLLSQNNDYMKRAKTSGMQYAAGRGLLNSSMAAGASHGAAIDAALPIATTDAGAINTQSLANQTHTNESRRFGADATNRANEFGALWKNQEALKNTGWKNEAGQFNADARNRREEVNLGFQNEAGRFNADARNRREEINLGYQNSAGEFNADWANRMATDKDRMAHDIALNNQQNSFEREENYLNRWLDIQNSNMTMQQKQTAIDELRLQSGVAKSLSGVTIGADGSISTGGQMPTDDQSVVGQQPTDGQQPVGPFTQAYNSLGPVEQQRINATLMNGEKLEMRDEFMSNANDILRAYEGKWVPYNSRKLHDDALFFLNTNHLYNRTLGIEAKRGTSKAEIAEMNKEIQGLFDEYLQDLGMAVTNKNRRRIAQHIRANITGRSG